MRLGGTTLALLPKRSSAPRHCLLLTTLQLDFDDPAHDPPTALQQKAPQSTASSTNLALEALTGSAMPGNRCVARAGLGSMYKLTLCSFTRIKTMKALQSRKSNVNGHKLHPNSRRAKQLQRVELRTKKLDLQGKVQRVNEIKRGEYSPVFGSQRASLTLLASGSRPTPAFRALHASRCGLYLPPSPSSDFGRLHSPG